jgi:hypothetical protein
MTDSTLHLGFSKLNDMNYVKWLIQIEVELIKTSLWLMINIEVATDGKDTAAIAAEIAVKKGRGAYQKWPKHEWR